MEIHPQTLFTGQQALWLSECGSTNTEAQRLLGENRASEGFVVLTDYQTAGRGQRGNAWEAAPAENLMLSLVWKPTFLAAKQQFLLSQAVALAVYDWANALLTTPLRLRVKWPNDLYFGPQKLGGILIENSLSGPRIQHSIVGLGLNVNQQDFENRTATSLSRLTGHHYNRKALTNHLLECLEARYLQLRAGEFVRLRRDYLQVLYRFQETHDFEVDGQRVAGRIVGVEEDGRLIVALEDGLRRFGLQEIRHL